MCGIKIVSTSALAASLAIGIPLARAQTADTPVGSRQQTAFAKAIETEVQQSSVPGAAVVVVQGGTIIYQRAFGIQRVLGNSPVTLDTLFPLGSVSKAFTAMALLMLADKGLLSLDDPPRKFLPDFRLRDPDADSRITIRNLLTHSSGLGRADYTWQGGLLSREEVVRLTSRIGPTAKLGKRFQYSNNNYAVAGEVLARALGISWEQAIAEQLFKPLGMNATLATTRHLGRRSDSASGHYLFNVPGLGPVTIPVPTTDATNVGAAAAMASNARDLAQWLRFLLARGVSDDIRLLSAEAFDRAFSNQISIGTTSYGAVYYGLGWFVTQYKGHKLVTHGGKLGGFESIVALLPDQQLGYALLTNVHESVLPGIVLDHTLTHLVAARTPANTGSKAQEKGTKVAPKAQ